MLKSEVLSLLSDGSELSKSKGPEDAWCVNPKGAERKLGCGALVQFAQDRLVYVSKTLATAAGGDSAAVTAALFSTFQEVAKTGKTELTFSTQDLETDGHMRLRILSFIAGDKRYTITDRQPVGPNGAASRSVDLTESFVVRIQ
jgi:thiamine pyrophosphate-dependent acetolactate synthase large subunit-like protein